ncbi:SpoIIE family protein phosphatase [Luteimicrobium subarcticum]|uniref:GAF domain-containing protein n=1 Tax=Luteimicrobium subarcticum TaxID=620910 RepID=A0A2M8WU30_9MICO|nr:SpoIIE family protein phosphatase [Luteimicrobium subarcticum]PJI94457.1 GAF domain-containing protein [Luteimicrobium subarcticum]
MPERVEGVHGAVPLSSDDAFLAPGEPVDLDNCAREPIHVPGLIQPRGVLLVVLEETGEVLQVSANAGDVLGVDVPAALGARLSGVLGSDGERVLRSATRTADLAAHNPYLVRLPATADRAELLLDAVVHRPPLEPDDTPVLVIELEAAAAARPLAFPNTYRGVRQALGALEQAATLGDLFAAAAHHVRLLTGFDRVMVYRFDADYNGEVVAESKRDDLNPFLGLHYPATDIPAQARALYEKNWIRLIADVAYTPVPLVPTCLPTTGRPLDLTYSTLRSVSPIHCEYLGNMGVGASMSISLLRDGRLWGLIACHHYSGTHEPSFEVRTAAEFLGSTLSVRLVAQSEEERAAAVERSASLLSALVAQTTDADVPLATLLTRDDRLLEALGADGVVVRAEGRTASRGAVPGEAGVLALLGWAATSGEEIVHTDRLGEAAPDVARSAPDVAGVLAILLPDGQEILWLRTEVAKSVDWGGDPHNKAIARLEGDTVRLSPRKSFDRWREVVSGHSLPWGLDAREAAGALRRHLVEVLYRRGRRDVRATQALQRSLLPDVLPSVPGWTVDARYDAAGTGLVGGDWYDVMPLRDGRVALVVGDVTGHGLDAAAAMGQLRNGLRSALVSAPDLAAALTQFGAVAAWTMAGQVATLAVVVLDPSDGTFEHAFLGHPPALVADRDRRTRWVDRGAGRPVGVGDLVVDVRRDRVPEGGVLILFTDGLVERRDESIVDGLDRLARVVAARSATTVDDLVALVRDPASTDDATFVLARHDVARPGAS